MSPVVFKFPVIVRSEDKEDAGGFAFAGADGAGAAEEAGLAAGDGGLAGAAGLLASGVVSDLFVSLILLLENIWCGFHIFRGVNCISIDAHLIVKVHAG